MQPFLRRAAQQCERKIAYRWQPVREEDVMTSDERKAGRRCPGQLRCVWLRARRSLRKLLSHEQPVRPDGDLDVAPVMDVGSTRARLATVHAAMPLHPDAQASQPPASRFGPATWPGSRISRASIRRIEMIQLPAPPVEDQVVTYSRGKHAARTRRALGLRRV